MLTNYKDLKTTVTAIVGAIITLLPSIGVVLPPFWSEAIIAATIVVLAFLMHMDKTNIALAVSAVVLIIAAKFGLNLEAQALTLIDGAIITLLGLVMKDKANDTAPKVG